MSRTFSKARKVVETSGSLPCVTGIADEIVVYGYNSEFSNHDENRAVLVRLGFASTWTNVNSGALEFPSLAVS